jgi:serine/threonine protein kinase
MSPEQVLGRGCDHRADIYSFGVLLYEMLSGNPPFREGDLAYHHLHTPPPPLEGVSEPLAELVLKCLEKEADKRPANFEEILDALNIM